MLRLSWAVTTNPDNVDDSAIDDNGKADTKVIITFRGVWLLWFASQQSRKPVTRAFWTQEIRFFLAKNPGIGYQKPFVAELSR